MKPKQRVRSIQYHALAEYLSGVIGETQFKDRLRAIIQCRMNRLAQDYWESEGNFELASDNQPPPPPPPPPPDEEP